MKTLRNLLPTDARRWLTVTVFATAMAWVEAAVVFYLRTMIDRIEPYQPNPLPQFTGFARAELVRELATLVMLVTVGWLAGRDLRSRLGYSLIAFGVWDVFYYIFLKVLTGWPHSLSDWDVLFLIPLPWWGPVWAPVSIAALMLLWGTLATQVPRLREIRNERRRVWLLNLLGVALALYAFMQDSIRVAGDGTEALRNLLPEAFNWRLFVVALGLMAAPVFDLTRHLRFGRMAPVGDLANE